MDRIAKARSIIEEYEVDALLLYGKTNVRYVSGFTGDSTQLLITEGGAYLFTDGRYDEQSHRDCPGFTIMITNYAQRIPTICECVEKAKVRVLGMDLEDMTGALLNAYEDAVDEEVEFTDISQLIAEKRMIKDADELEHIRKAAVYSDLAFDNILKFIKPGVRELDLKAELSYFAIKQGTDFSFPPVIVSGVRGSLPHGEASDKTVGSGEFITFDMGYIEDGYFSDFTRTVAVGEPTKRMREVYETVKIAQKLAADAAKAGMTGRAVDAVAREYIVKQGYGNEFVHGLGHGVGLDIHEEPRVSTLSDTVLAEGMVVTIEPGIYIPGEFGVRIEDMAIIKNDGNDILNVATRELIVV